MSNFFHQLVARHQGNVESVQPWIPTRFASDGGESPATEVLWEERWAAAAPSRSVPPKPVFPPPIQAFPSASSVAPANTTTRIETVTRWIHQVERDSSIANPPEPIAPAHPPSIVPPTVEPSVQQSVPVSETASPTILLMESPERLPSTPTVPQESLRRSPTLTASVVPPSPSPIEPIAPVQPSQPPLPSLQPPTVRVTIGRVEIRTVSAPAASTLEPRRTTPVRRPALSLDAYLQQRSRRP
jgi:hypothetical protein